MAASLSIIAAKDGTGTTVAGGLQALDLSGAGSGPWSLANILVDGTSGTNRAGVTTNSALKIEGVGAAGTATGGVMTVQGVASMTPVQVSQATAANLNATVVGTGTFAVQATQSGNWTARVVGNSGSTLDAAPGSAVPTNALQIGGSDGTSLRALLTNTSGNLLPISKVWDGTNTAAVKAASTAPVATDPALVVAISPNSVNANGQAAMASSAPVTIANNQSTLAVAYDTSQIFDGATGTTATVTKTKISVSTATTTTIVASTASKKTRVLALYLVVGGANNLNWQSHTTTSTADGVQDFAANGGIVLPFNPLGWFDTVSGEALDLVTSTSAQVGGLVITAAV